RREFRVALRGRHGPDAEKRIALLALPRTEVEHVGVAGRGTRGIEAQGHAVGAPDLRAHRALAVRHGRPGVEQDAAAGDAAALRLAPGPERPGEWSDAAGRPG